MIKSIFKRFGVYVSAIAALFALTAVGAGLYTMSSDISDLKASDETQDIRIDSAINAAHEKELQCKDMLHAVNLAKRDYKYCKGEQ